MDLNLGLLLKVAQQVLRNPAYTVKVYDVTL